MNQTKNLYIIISIFILIIIRLFISGRWFSSIIIAGFLIALYDMIIKVQEVNRSIVTNRKRVRYSIVIVVLHTQFLIILTIFLINATVGLKWINTTIVDELTLLTLMISLSQKLILDKINNYINK